VGAPVDDRAKIEVKYAEAEIGIGGTGLFSESANLSLGLARGGGPEEVLFRIGIGILTYPGIGAFLVETISPLSLSELVEGINRSIRGFH
jgi:hypothetical protein